MHTMTIGQVARCAGVGVETVRFYERQGLLDAPPCRASGYRQYPQEVIRRIQFIKRAKDLGFSLKETRELLSLRVNPEMTCSDVKLGPRPKLPISPPNCAICNACTRLWYNLPRHAPARNLPVNVPFRTPGKHRRPPLDREGVETMHTTFDVKGMHCDGCAQRIKTALQQFPAITTMEVDHQRDLVAIEHQGADLEAVAMAMARLGFTVTQT